MAVAKKCDACGQFYEYDSYESHANGISMVHFDEQSRPTKTINKYELCPECMEQINAIVNKEEV